ncbi:MAG: hypothetical protein ACKKMW_02535 [Candidatus Nealsonbacteria bacterium]
MQNAKLQFKIPKWIDIILVLIIVVEIGCIIYLKIDFLNKNSGAIQAISTIVLIFITTYYAYRNYKFEKIQLSRPHSERLGENFSKWLTKVSGLILDPRNLPDQEERAYWDIYRIENPPLYINQHLKSGYPHLYSEYQKWKDSVNKYNDKLKTFIKELNEGAKKEIKLPSCSPSYNPPCAYYQRMITFTLRKILTDFPSGEATVSIVRKSSSELGGLGGSGEFFELSWGGAGLVIQGNMISEAVAKDFIKKLRDSPKIIEKIRKFYEETETLAKQSEELNEKIRTKIIDKARYKGIIEGKCNACVL